MGKKEFYFLFIQLLMLYECCRRTFVEKQNQVKNHDPCGNNADREFVVMFRLYLTLHHI